MLLETCVAEERGCAAEVGAFAELLGCAAELFAGCTAEDAGIVAELFTAGCAADDRASRISLLIASWLCGISRYLLLDENASLSELSGEGAFGGSCDSIGSVLMSPPLQALNEYTADMPNVAAIVFFAMDESFAPLATIFFSIFKRELLSPMTHNIKYYDFGKKARFT